MSFGDGPIDGGFEGGPDCWFVEDGRDRVVDLEALMDEVACFVGELEYC